MKSIAWVGNISPQNEKLKTILDSLSFQKKLHINFFDLKNSLSSPQFFNHELLLSEDLNALNEVINSNPKSKQILICQSQEFIKIMRSGIRPVNRSFFIIDQMNEADFTNFILNKLNKSKRILRSKNNSGSISAMKNSLGVLKNLTDQHLLNLQNFTVDEDLRKKQFRSLIRLIRNLSMSLDMEDIASAIKNELNTFLPFESLTFLFFVQSENNVNYINFISGKYHEQPISINSKNHRLFLMDLVSNFKFGHTYTLNSNQIETLGSILRKKFQNIIATPILDYTSSNKLIALIDIKKQIQFEESFFIPIFERLSFVKLAIEKIQAQEEIKSKNKLWASIFDDLSDPLAIIDSQNNLIRHNNRFNELLTELNKIKLSQIDNQPKTLDLSKPAVFPLKVETLNTPEQTEISVNNKIFHTRFYKILDQLQHNKNAYIIHAVDVSIERALYSRMIQSEKMMAIGQLAGDLSEALSKPLKKIADLCQANASQKMTTTAQNDLKEIFKASQRSLLIMDDFEKFSKGHVSKTPLHAEAIIEKTIPLIKALIHGHRFQLLLSETRHLVLGSLSLLQQALYNLLRNAHQSMTQPGLLQISTESITFKSHPGVKIKICDNGPGVPEEIRPLLFQPFVSSKGSQGTGLGLNIVKQVIEGHDGSVGYEPNSGGGSIFWIWLPLHQSENKE